MMRCAARAATGLAGVCLLLAASCLHDLTRPRPGDAALVDAPLTLCESPARCDDGLPCTTDRCVGGQCEHTTQAGYCAEGGICHKEGASTGDPCRICAAGELKDVRPCVRTFAGTCGSGGYLDGAALKARFNLPADVAFDDKGGALYVSDQSNHVVRKIAGGKVSTIGRYVSSDGNPGTGGYKDGAASESRFNWPLGVLWHDGRLLVTERGNHLVRAVEGGQVTTVAGTPGSPGKGEDQLLNPGDLVELNDDLLVVEQGDQIRRLIPSGGKYKAISGSWAGALSPTKCPTVFSDKLDTLSLMGLTAIGRATEGTNKAVFVTLMSCGVIVQLAAGKATLYAGIVGQPGTTDGPLGKATLHKPVGVAGSASGHVFFTSYGGHQLRKVAYGQVKTLAGHPKDTGHRDGPGTKALFKHPTGLALDPTVKTGTHRIYIADTANHCIRVVHE